VRRFGRAAGLLAFALLLILNAGVAQACPVCYGASDSAMAGGVNNAVFLMLGIIVLVQIGFAALFWTFWRRSKEIRQRREKFRLVTGFGR